jgi:hypothetical protein
VTLAALSKIICLAWSVYGRPPLDSAECDARARDVLGPAVRHELDPVLLVAVDVQECDLRDDVAAPVYRQVGRRRVLAGHDRCPMGVRVMDARREYSRAELYEVAAAKLDRWRRWCAAGHPGNKYRGSGRHHFVAHYNPGNPTYEHQVLTFYARLRGRPVPEERVFYLTPRSREIERRLRVKFSRSRGES